MGKKSPSMPAAPDPVKTAQAQGAENMKSAIANAELNRINQYTPQGSLTYQRTGTNPDGTPIYSQTTTYSPEQQQLYDQQMGISNALSGLASNNIQRVADAQSTPFTYDNMTPIQTGIQGGQIQNSPGYNIGPQYGFNAGGNVQSDFDTAGQQQRQIGPYGNVQGSLDYSGAPGLPGQNDFSADAKRVADALYGQATSRLDPQFEQQQRQLATQLAGKGITEDSVAYRNAMDQFARQRTDAYNQANWSAIGAGGAEQSRLFGLGLQARQQAVGETTQQGQFANAAQQQQYGQQLGAGQFANEAQQQQYAQNQSAMQSRNAAQQQQFTQNQALADFFNQSQQTGYNQAMSNAAFANQAQQQGFNQAQQNATFNNQARQQQIQEAAYLRNMPLNDIATLLGTSGGVQNPTFSDYSAVNVSPVDYAGLVQNNYDNQMQQYQIKQQQQSQGLGGLFGLGGSVLGGLASSGVLFSDLRLKSHVHRIGTTSKGIPTYLFNYIGNGLRQIGVIAQDVIKAIPEAIILHPSGYMMVDYGKVI